MISLPDDEHVSGTGAPAAELEYRSEPDDAHVGAHARRLEIAPVEVPRHPLHDRPRYYLRSREPDGVLDEVVLVAIDDGRLRYFATRDGDRLTEVDAESFERRRDGGAGLMLELDEQELAELESELRFVRPVRGRDPIAESTDAAAEPWAEPEPAPEPEPEPAPAGDTDAESDIGADAEPGAVLVDDDETMEEFEADMIEMTTNLVEVAGPLAAVPTTPPADAIAAATTSPTDAVAQVSLAKGIAFVAHRGQLDRSGAAYVDHPGRVAERFDAMTQWVEASAAWLHDVLEDTPITAPELLEAGVLPEVVGVVQLLTRTPDVAPDEYYARIRRNPAARRVKLADIDDNTARWRLRRLDYEMQLRLVEKYAVARRALGAD